MADSRQFVPNVVENTGGNLTFLSNGWVWGWKNSAWLTLPQVFQPKGHAFEVVIHFKYAYSDTWQAMLFCDNTNTKPATSTFSIYTNKNHVGCNVHSGSAWYGEFNGTTTLEVGKLYYVKVVRETATSNYKLYLSADDGVTWNLEATSSYNNDAGVANRTLLGTDSVCSQLCKDAINIYNSYINIDGKRWWSGYKAVDADLSYVAVRNGRQAIPNITAAGGVKWDGPSKVWSWNFNNTSYLRTIPAQFGAAASTANNWEMVFRFAYTALNDTQALYADDTAYENLFGISNAGKLRLTISNATDSFNIANMTGTTTLENDKAYRAKAEFTGSAYNLYLSDGDGAPNWHLEATVNSTTRIPNRGTWRIGVNRLNTQWLFPFKGGIDLYNSYINIDGKRWWSGVNFVDAKHYYLPTLRKPYDSNTLPDVNIVGNIRPDQYGRFAGFSSSQYVTKTVPVPSTITRVEYIVDIMTPPTWGSDNICFTSGHPWNQLPTIVATPDGRLRWYLSGDGSTNNIVDGLASSQKLNLSTRYWVKYMYTGSKHNLQVSADAGKAWQTWSEVTNSTPPKFDGFIVLGINYWGLSHDSSVQAWTSYVWVTNCFLSLNGNTVWNGNQHIDSVDKSYPALIHLAAQETGGVEPDPEPQALYYCYENLNMWGGGIKNYCYAKPPEYNDLTMYVGPYVGDVSTNALYTRASKVSELKSHSSLRFDYVREDEAAFTISGDALSGTFKHTRDKAHDLYE